MKKITKKKIRIKTMFAIFFVIILLFSLWQNNIIIVTKLQYSNKKIPKEFNEFKVIHISDLHNKKVSVKFFKLYFLLFLYISRVARFF